MSFKQIILLFIISITLYAQTPYSGFSPFYKTGEVIFQQKDAVALRSEHIELTFFGNKTALSVTYSIEQPKDSLSTINCALPVHLINETNELFAHVNAAQSLKNFLFKGYTFNNRVYEGLFEHFTMLFNDSTLELQTNWHESDDIIFIESQLPMKKGRNTLTVRYEVENHYFDTQFATSMIPGFSERTFTYDFASATCWGENIIDSLTMKVFVRGDAALFFNEDYSLPRMLKKRNDFLGAPYRVMEFSMEQVLLSNLAPISLKADIAPALITEHIKTNKLTIPQEAITITTSKAVNEHTLVNLTDDNLATGVEINGGRGNWIEITIDTSKITEEITGIYLLNGNWRSENHYKANRRIKTAKVEVAGATVSAEQTSQQHKINYSAIDTIETDSSFYGNKILELFSQKGSNIDKVLKCRITVQDIFYGKKYKDLILSEIILTGKKKESLY